MSTATAQNPSKTADVGLTEGSRTAILAILDRALADEVVLSAKTRNFHWNVTGFHFSAMHKFFEEQYAALDEIVDETAERARALGGRSLGSLKEFLLRTRLTEAPARDHSEGEMVTALLADHTALIKSFRADVDECTRLGDAGTADFLTGLLKTHEKMAWMLRSFVN
ncbi:MAG: DNA starvation/stationary phase protection protein [Elusimicrobia bacterium]|nr:DNA starvation/stationary phase protection protein [Elusimicrobiota bacterium]